ncbi:hypothetical protein EVAR_14495_1 [Eumeta japonica]|uniref:Uncharacterized protein n=1 Tax=Eumeta variegata TaxID=151549 RepID=A0A4C1U3B7_EUMVA|nr:hypothetical protein EVAR_14495_1 [Eumeta japonica]
MIWSSSLATHPYSHYLRQGVSPEVSAREGRAMSLLPHYSSHIPVVNNSNGRRSRSRHCTDFTGRPDINRSGGRFGKTPRSDDTTPFAPDDFGYAI